VNTFVAVYSEKVLHARVKAVFPKTLNFFLPFISIPVSKIADLSYPTSQTT